MSFLREVFSEDGQGSYSRLAAGAIVLSVLSWVTYLVFKNHAIPDLTGPSWFLVTGTGIHYGTNKAPDIMAAFRNKLGLGQP